MQPKQPISLTLKNKDGDTLWHTDLSNVPTLSVPKRNNLHLTVSFDFEYMGQRYHAVGDVVASLVDDADGAVVDKLSTTAKEVK